MQLKNGENVVLNAYKWDRVIEIKLNEKNEIMCAPKINLNAIAAKKETLVWTDKGKLNAG